MSSALADLDDVVSTAALEVCQTLQSAGYEAYIVGGSVRDALLGRAVSDWDVTTDALPEQVQAEFRRTIPTGIQHGTVTVMVSHEPIEVTTFRGEGAYTDGRRPDQVTFGVPLREDLARRDFVINAIAYDPIARSLVDPFGGAADIEARLIRAVGDPVERFGEDGLRVMRAVRFAATLEFELDPATEAAIPGALGSLAKVSVERVRVELLKLLGAHEPSRGLEVADRTGVLGQILPERTHPWTVCEQLSDDAVLRFAALVAGLEAKPVGALCRRLTLSNDERARVTRALAHHLVDYAPEWTDGQVRRFVARATRAGVVDALALRAVVAVPVPELTGRVEQVLAAGDPLYANELAVSGADVMAVLSVEPGRIVGKVLARLLERVLDEPSLNVRASLEPLIREAHDALSG